VEVTLELVEGLIDLDRLGQEVHVPPGLSLVVGAPDGLGTLGVVVHGQEPGYVWSRFDDEADWWRESVGIGHAQRARQDWLLGDWLIAETGRVINVGRLYGEFRFG
jgi:hypothetical protein